MQISLMKYATTKYFIRKTEPLITIQHLQMISLNWYFPTTDTAEGTKNMLLQHFFYKGCFSFSSKAQQSYEHSHWCFTQKFWWLETGQKEHLLSGTGYSPGWTMSLLMSVKSYWTWKINLLQISWALSTTQAKRSAVTQAFLLWLLLWADLCC